MKIFPVFHTAVPLIAQRPADTHVTAGNNAIFECGVRGNPKPTIFWSLQNNDTILFPKESWNEFHAEDTKDFVSTLIVHVSVSCTAMSIGTCVRYANVVFDVKFNFKNCNLLTFIRYF